VAGTSGTVGVRRTGYDRAVLVFCALDEVRAIVSDEHP
jgi:hypothetical protein